jgi:hypothetical protein
MRGSRLCVAVLALLLAGGTTAALLQSSARAPAVTAGTLTVYEQRLLPLVQDGGRTVEQGIKPAMQDLRYRHVVPAAVIAKEGDGWIQTLSGLRSKIAQLPSVGDLQPVTTAFVMAMDGYIVASRTFRDAAAAPQAAQQRELFGKGVALAEEADHLYDRASARLQRLRHDLGLPPNLTFPNPAAGSHR